MELEISPFLVSLLQGAIKSLIRAVPVAVLQPFLGMSSGIGTIMAGASHSLDPKKTRDQKVVFKSKP